LEAAEKPAEDLGVYQGPEWGGEALTRASGGLSGRLGAD
jgi:hypothetical protein